MAMASQESRMRAGQHGQPRLPPMCALAVRHWHERHVDLECVHLTRIVPEKAAYVIERFGRYQETLGSGLHFLIPLVGGGLRLARIRTKYHLHCNLCCCMIALVQPYMSSLPTARPILVLLNP